MYQVDYPITLQEALSSGMMGPEVWKDVGLINAGDEIIVENCLCLVRSTKVIREEPELLELLVLMDVQDDCTFLEKALKFHEKDRVRFIQRERYPMSGTLHSEG